MKTLLIVLFIFCTACSSSKVVTKYTWVTENVSRSDVKGASKLGVDYLVNRELEGSTLFIDKGELVFKRANGSEVRGKCQFYKSGIIEVEQDDQTFIILFELSEDDEKCVFRFENGSVLYTKRVARVRP